MSNSIAQRMNGMVPNKDVEDIRVLLTAIRADLEALRVALNTHTHGGITAGAGTSGAANAATVASLTLLP